jgi:biotin transport system substrate-specific component
MTTSAYSLSTAITPRRYAIAGVLGFVVALAMASQIAIPLPGTPVPITLQPMIVVLAGMMLGARLGVASMVLYLGLGALGLPVFAPVGAPGIARFLGPTGGYLIAYPVAALTAGVLAQRCPSLFGRWLAAVLGIAVLFVGGLAQLTILTGSFAQAVALGMTPFAILDVVKAFAAALIARPRVRSARN